MIKKQQLAKMIALSVLLSSGGVLHCPDVQAADYTGDTSLDINRRQETYDNVTITKNNSDAYFHAISGWQLALAAA